MISSYYLSTHQISVAQANAMYHEAKAVLEKAKVETTGYGTEIAYLKAAYVRRLYFHSQRARFPPSSTLIHIYADVLAGPGCIRSDRWPCCKDSHWPC